MKAILLDEVYPRTKIHELFQVNVEALVKIFKEKIAAEGQSSSSSTEQQGSLHIIQDMEYNRLSSTVDMDLALLLFNQTQDKTLPEAERQQICVQKFQQCLWHLNNEAARKCWDNLRHGVENLANYVSMQQEKENGTKRLKHSDKLPLFPQYFTQPKTSTKWEEDEEIMHSPDQRKYIMLKNGWVPNEGFPQTTVEPKSQAYFRRDVHCWTHSVKLRYGNCPNDCKYLWERMEKYTCSVAKIFHGINVVDLLSSPIHVCEHMLKLVRKIRPNAYICAKLDADTKNVSRIINRLGLVGVIQSTASVHQPHELASLLKRYGGKPVGSFLRAPLPLLLPSSVPIFVFDMALDDESPLKTRTPVDVLPTATLLAATRRPYGSCRGIDELVSDKIDATERHKLYCSWNEGANGVQINWTMENHSPGYVNAKTGVIRGRQAINRMHTFLSQGEFTEVQVEQKCENMIVVHRRSPLLAQSVIIAVRNCFWMEDKERREFVAPIVITGNLEEILYEGALQERKPPRGPKVPAKMINEKNKTGMPEESTYLKGQMQYELFLKEMASLFDSGTIEIITRTQSSVKEIDFIRFKAGAVIAMLVSMPKENRIAMSTLRKELARIDVITLPPESLQEIADFRSTEAAPDLKSLVRNISLPDYNRVLFRCENEQLRDEYSVGAYGIAGIGKLTYCGLHNIVYHLNKMRLLNNIDHPLCEHLRQGDWLPDYITKRLSATQGAAEVSTFQPTI
ncbi:hypothetical protein D918_05594 [Trichuris suis]|nr:hypothetical protein D918_05594 [Trichuris suis]